MITTTPMTGIILAGGKSSRMGTDKGLLTFKNLPLVQYCINALTPFAATIMIITANKAYDKFNVPCYADLYPDAGPLGGIHTGLHYSTTEANFVLSCDTPFITGTIIQKIQDLYQDAKSITTIVSNEKLMPTIGMYPKSLSPSLTKEIKKGNLKLTDYVLNQQYQALKLTGQESEMLVNINTKEEYQKLV